MSMLGVHAEALGGELTVYHEFLNRYKKTAMCVYGFVEGKDDPSFYRGAIEHMLPEKWTVDLWSVGNKDKVIQLYAAFDWVRFPKNRVVFFVDRDLSEFLKETLPVQNNVYITAKYSIENDIVSRDTCDRVLTEVCNLNLIEKGEKDKILDLFDSQLGIFREEMASVMVWIIYWKQNGARPSLNGILMKRIFKIMTGRVQVMSSPGGFPTLEEYIHNQCNIPYKSDVDITAIEREFKKANGHQKFIRGKYELWFLVEFVLSVYQNISAFSRKITIPPKMNVSLSQSNAITLIAPRARVPSSLKKFLTKTYAKYVAMHKDAA